MYSPARELASDRGAETYAAPESVLPGPVRKPGHTEGVLRAFGNGAVAAGVAPIVGEALRDPGMPLPNSLRSTMEQAFAGATDGISTVAASGRGISEPGDAGEREAAAVAARVTSAPARPTVAGGPDFSAVRVHTGADADAAARSISASAYTVGRDIAFAAGRYQPDTSAGRALLAHELTHVVQQQGASAAVVQRDTPADARKRRRDPRYTMTGSKKLSRGVLKWEMTYGYTGNEVVPVIQITFTPVSVDPGRQITFLQTVRTTSVSEPKPNDLPVVDVRTPYHGGEDIDEFDPFYGAEWDNVHYKWIPERSSPPVFARNQPSSDKDSSTYLFDAPWVGRNMLKLFESVVIVPETGEVLGTIRWGVKGISKTYWEYVPLDAEKDVAEGPSAEFLAAMRRFYASPNDKPRPDREERYDAIIDGYPANDDTGAYVGNGVVLGPVKKASVLNADQKAKLDPIVAALKQNPSLMVKVAGFADATEKDPMATSRARAWEVHDYLVDQGVPAANVFREGEFGAAWPLFPGDPKASRNRRVQVRLFIA